MKSLEIGHLVKIIKHCICFEDGCRNGTDQRVLLLISDAGQIGIEVMHEITVGSRERACEREVRESSQPSP